MITLRDMRVREFCIEYKQKLRENEEKLDDDEAISTLHVPLFCWPCAVAIHSTRQILLEPYTPELL